MHQLSWTQNDVLRKTLRLQVFSILNIRSFKWRDHTHIFCSRCFDQFQPVWANSSMQGHPIVASCFGCCSNKVALGCVQERYLQRGLRHRGRRNETSSILVDAAKPIALILPLFLSASFKDEICLATISVSLSWWGSSIVRASTHYQPEPREAE